MLLVLGLVLPVVFAVAGHGLVLPVGFAVSGHIVSGRSFGHVSGRGVWRGF